MTNQTLFKESFFWEATNKTKQNKTEHKKLANLVSSSELDSFENKFQINFFYLVPLPGIYFNCDKCSTFKTAHTQWLVLTGITQPAVVQPILCYPALFMGHSNNKY